MKLDTHRKTTFIAKRVLNFFFISCFLQLAVLQLEPSAVLIYTHSQPTNPPIPTRFRNNTA
jgi:hypothetical protein